MKEVISIIRDVVLCVAAVVIMIGCVHVKEKGRLFSNVNKMIEENEGSVGELKYDFFTSYTGPIEVAIKSKSGRILGYTKGKKVRVTCHYNRLSKGYYKNGKCSAVLLEHFNTKNIKY